ncbi:MAG: MFS transporter [Tissierellia bacterium]|nr:MFS transporter [Tissierellia bacterium]
MKERLFRFLNFKYAGLQGASNLLFSAMGAYGAVFLMSKGIPTSQMGILVALANIIAIILQPWLAIRIDRSQRFTIREFCLFLLVPTGLLLIAMLLFPDLQFFNAISYTLVLASLFSLMPVVSGAALFFSNRGLPLNFCIGRSFGSFAYAVGVALLGGWVEQFGTHLVLICSLVYLGFYMLFVQLLPFRKGLELEMIPVNPPTSENGFESTEEQLPTNSLTEFFLKYRSFVLVLSGIMFFFIFHNIGNTYMYHIVASLGGGTKEAGFALSLAAILEVPIILFYEQIARRLGHGNLLIVSGFSFLIKAVLLLVATTISGVYLSQSFQMLAFALFTASVVYYTNEVIHPVDLIKGQAMVTASMAVGGVIGSVIGGFLIDWLSVWHLILFSVICCLLGGIALYRGVKNLQQKSDPISSRA